MASLQGKGLRFGLEAGASVAYQAGIVTKGFANRLIYGLSGPLQYTSYHAYDNLITFELRRDAIRLAHNAAMELVANTREKVLKLTQESAQVNTTSKVDLIGGNKKKLADYGVVKLQYSGSDGGTGAISVPIFNELGERVTDGLTLSFEDEKPYKYTSNYLYSSAGDSSSQQTIETTTVFFVDIAPRISFSSSKKLIMTQVQGRNNSRKELLGGGDTIITISGNIMAQMPGNNNHFNRQEYPFAEVEVFRRIAEYNGILKISNYLCGTLGITRCIVQEFRLGNQEYANLQPYTMTCVAVEPDEANTAVDVISVLDQQIIKSSKEQWYDSILDLKKATRAAGDFLISGLDQLVSSI